MRQLKCPRCGTAIEIAPAAVQVRCPSCFQEYHVNQRTPMSEATRRFKQQAGDPQQDAPPHRPAHREPPHPPVPPLPPILTGQAEPTPPPGPMAGMPTTPGGMPATGHPTTGYPPTASFPGAPAAPTPPGPRVIPSARQLRQRRQKVWAIVGLVVLLAGGAAAAVGIFMYQRGARVVVVRGPDGQPIDQDAQSPAGPRRGTPAPPTAPRQPTRATGTIVGEDDAEGGPATAIPPTESPTSPPANPTATPPSGPAGGREAVRIPLRASLRETDGIEVSETDANIGWVRGSLRNESERIVLRADMRATFYSSENKPLREHDFVVYLLGAGESAPFGFQLEAMNIPTIDPLRTQFEVRGVEVAEADARVIPVDKRSLRFFEAENIDSDHQVNGRIVNNTTSTYFDVRVQVDLFTRAGRYLASQGTLVDGGKPIGPSQGADFRVRIAGNDIVNPSNLEMVVRAVGRVRQ